MTTLLRPARGALAEIDAARLISAFGSLAAVLARDCDDLGRVLQDQCAAKHLTAVRHVNAHLLRAELQDRPLFPCSEALKTYLRAVMGPEAEEEFRVLYLDASNGLLSEKVISRGSTKQAPIYPRNIMRQALNFGSTALILVHNHPSGNPEPSWQDVETTRRLMLVAQGLEIVVHDHLIVTRSAVTSLKERGLI